MHAGASVCSADAERPPAGEGAAHHPFLPRCAPSGRRSRAGARARARAPGGRPGPAHHRAHRVVAGVRRERGRLLERGRRRATARRPPRSTRRPSTRPSTSSTAMRARRARRPTGVAERARPRSTTGITRAAQVDHALDQRRRLRAAASTLVPAHDLADLRARRARSIAPARPRSTRGRRVVAPRSAAAIRLARRGPAPGRGRAADTNSSPRTQQRRDRAGVAPAAERDRALRRRAARRAPRRRAARSIAPSSPCSTMMRLARGGLGAARAPSRSRRSITWTISPRSEITPRTAAGTRGIGVIGAQAHDLAHALDRQRVGRRRRARSTSSSRSSVASSRVRARAARGARARAASQRGEPRGRRSRRSRGLPPPRRRRRRAPRRRAPARRPGRRARSRRRCRARSDRALDRLDHDVLLAVERGRRRRPSARVAEPEHDHVLPRGARARAPSSNTSREAAQRQRLAAQGQHLAAVAALDRRAARRRSVSSTDVERDREALVADAARSAPG